ncbi:hypothetical protein A7P95_08255 [Eikenella longinqua]|uniref:PA14 domain-containing protein n=1 Tax=Eikenella longinqua TaxID=1795827 RepID=A0A1A9RWE1_9NEIS|nr:hypothetical protein [Eikenella longinqua]OAM26741.1 hypothetical protein A7P95_08255 [Eikenella longinqua]
MARETVSSIAINYAYNEFHGIPSPTFGAYWAGRLHIPQRGKYRIATNLSHAELRVLLNRHLVMQAGDQSSDTTILLEPGDYLLEVEYANRWHTTGFQLTVAPAVKEIDDDALAAAIAAQRLPAGTVAYAVGVSSSTSRDNRIILQGPRNSTPYVLILSSHKAVRWEVHGRQPQLVVHTGSRQGSSVHTDGNVPQIAWSGHVPDNLTDTRPPTCHCMPTGGLYCGNRSSDLRDFTEIIQRRTGLPLRGVSTQHNASLLPIPQTIINPTALAASDQRQQELAKARRACLSSPNSRQSESNQPIRMYAP